MAMAATKGGVRADLSSLTGLSLDTKSPTYTFDQDGVTVDVVIAKVAWADHKTHVQAILGGYDGVDVHAPIMLDGTNFPNVYATACSVSVIGGRTDATSDPAYEPEYAQLDIQFETVPWVYLNDSPNLNMFVSEEYESEAEFLTVPPKDLFWTEGTPPDSDPVSDDEAPGIRIKTGSWTITRYYVVNDANQLQNMLGGWVGTCGACDTGSEWWSPTYDIVFGNQTLLMGTPVVTPQWSPWGKRQWKIEIPFSYKPGGWNHFLRSGYTTSQQMWTAHLNPLPGGSYKYEPIQPISWDDWLAPKVVP